MKREEVPQDHNVALGGAQKAVYAVDESGHYVTVPSTGWSVEETVTEAAVEEYRRLARDAFARARSGTASTLEFHMHDRRLDPPMLAQVAGTWTWRVRRHLRPEIFARLSDAWIARYADALGLSPAALRALPESAP